MPLASVNFAHYFYLRKFKEAEMISYISRSASDWLVELSLVTVMGLPPKDPNDDDDDEEDDEDEGEEEPAVVREPDE
jgi:hypothetical protein